MSDAVASAPRAERPPADRSRSGYGAADVSDPPGPRALALDSVRATCSLSCGSRRTARTARLPSTRPAPHRLQIEHVRAWVTCFSTLRGTSRCPEMSPMSPDTCVTDVPGPYPWSVEHRG